MAKELSTKNKIYTMTTCAVITAIICIFAPMSIPIGPVPISLTNLILYFAIFILGTKGTLISYTVYMLLGIVGLPVFSKYEGGIGKVAGPTGGYLIGFFFMILISGIALEKSSGKLKVVFAFLGMVVGTVVAYAFGTVWFIYQMEYSVTEALAVCVIPFIPFDLLKMVAACVLGMVVRKPLVKQNLIQ